MSATPQQAAAPRWASASAPSQPAWPGPALAAMSSPDRALLRQCADLEAVEAEIDIVLATRLTLADEQRTDPELRTLYERCDVVEKAIVDAPQTLIGAKAMAEAIVRRWPFLLENGERYAANLDDWLVINLAEFISALPI